MTDQRRIAQIGEDALVASVLTRFGALPPGVRIGPGDDAAVLEVAGPVVVSTDTLVEGYDFRRDWSSAQDVGVKTAAQNLADIAAMGARPLALLISLAAPGELPASWATHLADGLEQECRRAGAVVVGGDVSEATEIVITGTSLGVLEGPPVRRDGARPGDVVALAGRTGPSAAGLALLSAGVCPAPSEPDVAQLRELIAAHRRPRPPYPAGPRAARSGASALIDTSDGLLRDATRVAVASGVRIDLDPAALIPPAELCAAAERLGSAQLAGTWQLTGGEDHALLACFPPEATIPAGFRPIGRVLAAHERPGVTIGGQDWEGTPGWLHFRPAATPP